MENDIIAFQPRDAWVEGTLATVADLIAWARSKQVPVVYVRVAHRPSYVDAPPHAAAHLKSRKMLLDGARGAEIVDELKPQPDDPVVIKRRTSGFYNTELEVVLRGLGARTLLFTGKSTARAVESTVREARDRDFTCIVVSDGCLAGTRVLHDNALNAMGDWFAEVMTAAEAKSKFA